MALRYLLNDFRLSPYVQHCNVENGVVGLYSPFNHEVAFSSEAEWNAITKGNYNQLPYHVFHDLINRKFITDKYTITNDLKKLQIPPVNHNELWLVVTHSCNLACRYCVVEGNVSKAERDEDTFRSIRMPSSVAEAAIEKFFKWYQPNPLVRPRIVFYGGEPTLCAPLLYTTIPYIRHLERIYFGDSPVQILVITNGFYHDDKLTQLFKDFRVSVSVSLDGMEYHHDKVRRSSADEPTWEKAIKSLRQYQEAGLTTGICTTIGTHNVDDLPDIADFFAVSFGIPVQFQIPYQCSAGTENPVFISMAAAAAKTFEAFTRLRRLGLIEGLTARRVSMFTSGVFNFRDCGAVDGQIVVLPNGTIGPCHSLVSGDRFFSGDIRKPECSPYTENVFGEWWNRIPVNMPQCQSCPAIALCGGGCAYNALIKNGSLWSVDPQQCEYMKIFIEWLIRDVWFTSAKKRLASPVHGKTIDHESFINS